MTAVEAVNEFVDCGRKGKIGERNPRVFVGGTTRPTHEVLVALAEFARVEDLGNGKGRIVGDSERIGRCMGVKFGGVGIRFEKRDVEDRMETGEIWRETELVGMVGNGTLDGEWTESAVVKFAGRTCCLDVAAKQPHELVTGVDAHSPHLPPAAVWAPLSSSDRPNADSLSDTAPRRVPSAAPSLPEGRLVAHAPPPFVTRESSKASREKRPRPRAPVRSPEGSGEESELMA